MSDQISIKFNKKFAMNILLLVAILLSALILVELGIIAYNLKNGLLCG